MKNQTFQSLNNLTNEYGDSNDCVVKAITLITEEPYEKVHNFCRLNGRKFRRGCNGIQMVKNTGMTLNQIYLRFNKYSPAPYGKTVMNLRGLNPHKKYIIFTSSHMLAVVRGKVQDWTEDRQHRILSIYECDTSTLNENFLKTEERVVKGKIRKPRTSKVNWEMHLMDENGYTERVVNQYARKPSKVIQDIDRTFLRGQPNTKGRLKIYDVKNQSYVNRFGCFCFD